MRAIEEHSSTSSAVSQGGHWYDLQIEDRGEYLFCFVNGTLTDPQTRIEAWTEIIERCRDIGHDKLLVVQNSPGVLTDADAHTSSSAIAALGISDLKIAFVDLVANHYDTNQFCELVANNRGAFAKVFTNKEEAIRWLLH